MRRLFKKKNKLHQTIDPDEVLLDSTGSMGGSQTVDDRLELPLSGRSVVFLALGFMVLGLVLLAKVGQLQLIEGEVYAERSENNRLAPTPLFAERGVIYDVNRELLAWNGYSKAKQDFFRRQYTENEGLAHILGYLRPPLKDRFGFYYQDYYEGLAGVEKSFDRQLSGQNGLAYLEHDARGEVQAQNIIDRPQAGQTVQLAVDKRLQAALYRFIEETAEAVDFTGGAGVMMDVQTGEVVTLVSYPEFDPGELSNPEEAEKINAWLNDDRKPFLNRAINGHYTPGSVMKPFVAIGALEEELIDPEREITGGKSITVPNPYDPTNPSVFTDWRAHGRVDMRQALAVSSNIYFYHIGGGYNEVEGLGIGRLEKYMLRFGFGQPTGLDMPDEKSGVIPNPGWKAEHFSDGVWRLGDTYNTAIGQFGFTITPLQLTKAVAAIANGGYLIEPSVIAGHRGSRESTGVSTDSLRVVQEGMRAAVTRSDGTARGLNVPYLDVAAKTGTAELGVKKDRVNAWITGYFPADQPRYSFTVMMEEGPADNLRGGVYVMVQFLNWLNTNAPEYLEPAADPDDE